MEELRNSWCDYSSATAILYGCIKKNNCNAVAQINTNDNINRKVKKIFFFNI